MTATSQQQSDLVYDPHDRATLFDPYPVLRRLRDEGVEAIAVCFLFSFINPAHEQRAAAIIRTPSVLQKSWRRSAGTASRRICVKIVATFAMRTSSAYRRPRTFR